VKKNIIKLSVAAVIVSFALGAFVRTTAYPPYVRQAAKFGAKDCLFCHTQPAGGEGWNDRGKWLMAEKDKRKADSIEMEWLAEYKEGAATTGDAATTTDAENKGENKDESKGENKDAVKDGDKATEGDKAKDAEKEADKDKEKDKAKDKDKPKDGDKPKEEKKDKPPSR
jgi:hypothetical protein